MIDIIVAVFIASFVGSTIWIIQSSLRPLTQKLFSQTWHFYTSLIPVFFLLGGTEIMLRLLPLIQTAIWDNRSSSLSGPMMENISSLPIVGPFTPAGSPPLVQNFIDSLFALGNLNHLILFTLVIWSAGVIIFLAVNIKHYWAFKRFVLQNLQLAAETDQHGVTVFESPHALTPMVIGFLKPVIVMPKTRLGHKERALILSHELIHLKRRDLLVKFIVLLANSVHWFNPVIYSLSKQTNIYCELSCDEKVVQDMDEDDRRVYGETLLSMLEYGVMRRNPIGVSSIYHSKENMKRRLGNLMSVQKTKKSMVILSVVASLILVGSGGLAANYASAAVSPSSKYLVEDGSNVTVTHSDGTSTSYDKNGNIIPEPPRQAAIELTAEQMIDRTRLHLQKGLAVPEAYVTQLKKLGKTDELAGLFVGLTNIKLATQDGIVTFNVKDLLKP